LFILFKQIKQSRDECVVYASKHVRIRIYVLRTYRIHFVTGDASSGASQLHPVASVVSVRNGQHTTAWRRRSWERDSTHASNVIRTTQTRTHVGIYTRANIFMITIRITIRAFPLTRANESVREAGWPLFEREDGEKREERHTNFQPPTKVGSRELKTWSNEGGR